MILLAFWDDFATKLYVLCKIILCVLKLNSEATLGYPFPKLFYVTRKLIDVIKRRFYSVRLKIAALLHFLARKEKYQPQKPKDRQTTTVEGGGVRGADKKLAPVF